MRRYHPLACLSVLIGVGLFSCSKDTATTGADGARGGDFAVRKTFGAGPVTLTVELSSQEITTADALTCRLTLDVADDYEAEFPDLAFPEDVPGLVLTDHDQRQTAEENRRRDIRTYTLEPEHEGTITWPMMEVYYHRTNEVKEERFETGALEVTVAATPETAEILELKPIRGLVTVEQIEASRRRVWPWIVGGAAGLALLVALFVWRARRPRPAPPPRPAHEIALERLRQLADAGLIAAGHAEPFFVAVTTIVRDYIEQGFGLRAPEQTTEEFLSQIATAPAVARHRNVLEPFLAAADEVKFACLPADAATRQRAFETAEAFVKQSSDLEKATP